MKDKNAILILAILCLSNILFAQKNDKIEVLTNIDLYEYCKVHGLIDEVFEPNSKVVKDKFDYILGISMNEFREKHNFYKRSVHYHCFYEKLDKVQSNAELYSLFDKYPTMKTRFIPPGLNFEEFKDHLDKGKLRIYQIKDNMYKFVENHPETLMEIPKSAVPIAAKDFKAFSLKDFKPIIEK